MDNQYVEFLKEIGKRTGETSGDCDRMFLLSLLPVMKHLSPLYNWDCRAEVQESLRRKLGRPAAPEFKLIAFHNTSSSSPAALSDYNSNSQISLVDYTSTSQACPRNATDPANIVQLKRDGTR
jgi:hypothetical protein